MKSIGEFCSIARALDVLGERWSLLIVRELLCGSHRFGDIRRGIPRISRIELSDVRGRAGVRFLLLRRTEVSLCGENPGFPDELRIRGSLRTLTAWWRGDLSLADARSSGMVVDGRREHVRAFPSWFLRYAFADVAPAPA